MPFTDAYTQLTAAFGGLRVHAGPPRAGDGWVPLADVVRDPDRVRDLIAAEAAEGQREYGEPLRADVAASFALHRYAWSACLLLSVPWFLGHRVPRLPAGDVSFHRGEGRMTVRVGAFHCLPDDPAAALPGARVVPDEEALRGALRAAVAEHLGPLLAVFQPYMRRGPRAMWGMATDELSESLWYLGHLFGQEERAVAELAALLPGGTPPFAGAAGFRPGTLPDAGPGEEPGEGPGLGDPRYTRTRMSCCLYYTVRPADACGTCPRTCDPARLAAG